MPSKYWGKFLEKAENKSRFTAFLCEQWCITAQRHLKPEQSLVLGGGFTDNIEAVCITHNQVLFQDHISCSHEEADTRIMLHCKTAVDDGFKRLVIWSPDTDVFILGIYVFHQLEFLQEFWFKTGVKEKVRFIPMHTIATQFGKTSCDILLVAHAVWW